MAPGPSDRIQVLDYPHALPSKCAICGAGPETGRKFVDFGMSVDEYGVIYFCSFCVINIADAVGFIPVETYDEMANEHGQLIVENGTLEAENREFRRVFSTLRGLGVVIPDDDKHVDDKPVRNARKSASKSKSATEPYIPEQRTDESGSVEGSGNIPEPSSNIPDEHEPESGDDDLSF